MPNLLILIDTLFKIGLLGWIPLHGCFFLKAIWIFLFDVFPSELFFGNLGTLFTISNAADIKACQRASSLVVSQVLEIILSRFRGSWGGLHKNKWIWWRGWWLECEVGGLWCWCHIWLSIGKYASYLRWSIEFSK